MSNRVCLLVLLGLAYLASCTNAKKTDNSDAEPEETQESKQIGDLKGYNVNGPVKSIRTLELRVEEENGELITKDTFGNRQVNFNKAGMMEELLFFGSGDTATFRETREYDENGYLAKKVEVRLHWGSTQTTLYKRDDKGKTLEYEVYSDEMRPAGEDELKSIVKFEYDTNGDLIKELTYGNDGIPYNETIIRKLENGHRLVDERMFSGETIWWRYEREYDENDHFIRYTSLDSNSIIEDETIYRWNDKDQWIDRVNDDKDGWEKDVFTYSNRDEIIGITTLDSTNTIVSEATFEPEYDKYENLIFELKRIDGVATKTVHKIITYY